MKAPAGKAEELDSTVDKRLIGSRCRCPTCGEWFNSTSTFDRHRVGPWTDRGTHRRCLSVAEMTERGWSLNAKGFWIERRRAVPSLDAPRRSRNRPAPGVGRRPPRGPAPTREVEGHAGT